MLPYFVKLGKIQQNVCDSDYSPVEDFQPPNITITKSFEAFAVIFKALFLQTTS